jgi:two-component system, NarL family, nitrate/nitrite response regulator NarL
MNCILIADPHILCREALSNYIMHIEPNIKVEGFGDVEELTLRLKEVNADLAIVDHDLQGWEHISGVKKALLVRSLNHSVVAHSNMQGVFSRNLSSKMILKGIREILAGGTYFSSDGIAELTATPDKVEPRSFNLTAREKEVLSYLVKGQSNKDIARALDLQVVTVKLHVRGICRKMKAANRTQAALTARENGWS